MRCYTNPSREARTFPSKMRKQKAREKDFVSIVNAMYFSAIQSNRPRCDILKYQIEAEVQLCLPQYDSVFVDSYPILTSLVWARNQSNLRPGNQDSRTIATQGFLWTFLLDLVLLFLKLHLLKLQSLKRFRYALQPSLSVEYRGQSLSGVFLL